MVRGKFITFEGGEGTGKSTQVRLLAEAMERSGWKVKAVRSPGGTKVGEKLRTILKTREETEDLTPETELTLYYFKYCYIGINRANTVIRRVTDSNLDDAVKRKVTGEAYFLRAWNYFNLVRGYGRVPLYTEPISTLDMTTPEMAESIEQIYGQIISDLTLAEQQLEVNKVFGRVDKVAAQALLAKVYLNMASGKHYGAPGYTDFSIDADATYELAASWAKKVVNDYKQYYDFDDDLLHIYDVNYPDGPEHIFIMATDRSGTDEGMYTKIPLQFLPNNGSVPLYIKYGDGTLKRGNGNGWGVFIIEDEFMNTMFDPTDKRRTELMHHTFYDENGEEKSDPLWPVGESGSLSSGIYPHKSQHRRCGGSARSP